MGTDVPGLMCKAAVGFGLASVEPMTRGWLACTLEVLMAKGSDFCVWR